MNRFDIACGKKPRNITLKMLKVGDPFVQILDKKDDYYRIKIVFPLHDKNGKEICRRGGILQFRPEAFLVTNKSGEYLTHILHEFRD
jgi:hypothetical protein